MQALITDKKQTVLSTRVHVQNMTSPKSGKAVANQFTIHTDEGVFFQSYSATIAYIPHEGKTVLDEKYWNYSNTTSKYRRIFLDEGIDETRLKISEGIYILADLN